MLSKPCMADSASESSLQADIPTKERTAGYVLNLVWMPQTRKTVCPGTTFTIREIDIDVSCGVD